MNGELQTVSIADFNSLKAQLDCYTQRFVTIKGTQILVLELKDKGVTLVTLKFIPVVVNGKLDYQITENDVAYSYHSFQYTLIEDKHSNISLDFSQTYGGLQLTARFDKGTFYYSINPFIIPVNGFTYTII